jgi:hypothetical protein
MAKSHAVAALMGGMPDFAQQTQGGGAVSPDDRDWARNRPSFLEASEHTTIWKIAIGVALGSVIAGMVMYAADRYMTQRAISQAVESFNQTMRGINQTTAREQAEMRRRTAEEEVGRVQRDQQARQLRAEQQQASDDAQRAAQDAAARKERAWTKFYRKPLQCDGNPTSDTMVECANQFIRTKRQFEEAYAEGKL